MSFEFTVADRKFALDGLKLREALAAEMIIVQSFFPVGTAFSGTRVDAQGLKQALVGLGPQLQTLIDMFTNVCKVDWEGKLVPLQAFVDLVFERKTTMLLAWLMACIQWQYADFFDGTGLPLLTQAASQFTSLLGLTGASGESQPPTK